jgi:hypothetical protein
MATITVREYHPDSGALLSNISTLNFGRVASGTHSRVKVIDIAFGETTSVGNLKLGIIANGNIVINPDPSSKYSDGSTSNGHFGIESSLNFDSSKAAAPLTRHFPGLNGTATSTDANNVQVQMRSGNVSYYIYLDIEVSETDTTTAGNGSYKIFFDYA